MEIKCNHCGGQGMIAVNEDGSSYFKECQRCHGAGYLFGSYNTKAPTSDELEKRLKSAMKAMDDEKKRWRLKYGRN
jgi:DnaJ-class molecular chaperone